MVCVHYTAVWVCEDLSEIKKTLLFSIGLPTTYVSKQLIINDDCLENNMDFWKLCQPRTIGRRSSLGKPDVIVVVETQYISCS